MQVRSAEQCASFELKFTTSEFFSSNGCSGSVDFCTGSSSAGGPDDTILTSYRNLLGNDQSTRFLVVGMSNHSKLRSFHFCSMYPQSAVVWLTWKLTTHNAALLTITLMIFSGNTSISSR